MSALLHLGLANIVMASVIAALAVVASYWGRRPALAHGLWLLVLVKLVTPPLVSIPIPYGEEPPPPPVVETVTLHRMPLEPEQPKVVGVAVWIPTTPNGELMRRPIFMRPAPGQPGLLIDQDDPSTMQVFEAKILPAAALPETEPLLIRAEPSVVKPPPPETPSVWPVVLTWVWIAGAIGWFGLTAYNLVYFQRLLRHAEPASEAVATATAELATKMGLRRCPQVSLIPGQLPPMVWMGLCRPRILFPRDLLPRLSDEERNALLAHELAHIHRGDHLVRWLELLVAGLYWWLPLVWWGGKQMRAHEEECCDAWVVGEVSPRAYAGAILHTLDFLAGAKDPLPVGATGVTRIDGLKHRLTLIMEKRTPKQMSSLSCVSVAALGLVLLPLLPELTPTEAPTRVEMSIPATPREQEPKDEIILVSRVRQAETTEVSAQFQFVVPRQRVQPTPGTVVGPFVLPPQQVDPEATERLWQLRLRPLARPDEEEEDPDE